MKRQIKIVLPVVLFFLLSGTSIAQLGRFGLSYNMALPLGKTSDFIGKYTFRGFGMEAHWEISPELFLGFTASWNVFYDSERGTFVNENTSVTGVQYRYLNTLPLMLDVKKHFKTSGNVIPFVSLGTGPIYSEMRTDMGLWSVVNKGWQYGIVPGVGIQKPMLNGSDVIFTVRYNYGFKSTELEAMSFLGFNLGLLF